MTTYAMSDKGRWIADTIKAMRRDGASTHEITREVNRLLYGEPCCDGAGKCESRGHQ